MVRCVQLIRPNSLVDVAVEWNPSNTLTSERRKLIERAITEDFVLRHPQVAVRVYLNTPRTATLVIRYVISPGLRCKPALYSTDV